MMSLEVVHHVSRVPSVACAPLSLDRWSRFFVHAVLLAGSRVVHSPFDCERRGMFSSTDFLQKHPLSLSCVATALRHVKNNLHFLLINTVSPLPSLGSARNNQSTGVFEIAKQLLGDQPPCSDLDPQPHQRPYDSLFRERSERHGRHGPQP